VKGGGPAMRERERGKESERERDRERERNDAASLNFTLLPCASLRPKAPPPFVVMTFFPRQNRFLSLILN